MTNAVFAAPAISQPLSVTSLSPAQLAALAAERSPRLLGLACIGAGDIPSVDGVPLQRIAAPLLAADAALVGEAWHSAMTCIAGEGLGIRFRADANVLYGVIDQRCLRKKPMVFTTNKKLREWGQVLHDPHLAEALLDRILERGQHIRLGGPSWRTRNLDPEILEGTGDDE